MEGKKTQAIIEAKCASMHLYADDCFTHEICTMYLGRRINNDIKEKVIQDLLNKGIDTSFLGKNCSISDLYKGIEQTGNTITVYELIEWFNEQYNCIRQEAKDLPKLEFDLYKDELGKKTKTTFVLTDVWTDVSLRFEEEKLSINNFMRRFLMIDKESYGGETCIACKGRDWYGSDNPDVIKIDDSLIEAYLEISKKYIDYLKAYAFLRRSNDLDYKNTRYKKGPLPTYIYGSDPCGGVDPYRDLAQILVHYGNAGNDIGYIFTYDLGTPTLKNPHIVFSDNSCTIENGENYREEVLNNPHVLAKTIRINRDNLPFSIK